MLKREKVLDDIARVAGGGVGIISNLGGQIKKEIRLRVEEVAARLDLVPREDFERVEAMLKEARIKQEEILKRLDTLEGKNKAPAKPKKTTAKKTAPKKASPKKAASKSSTKKSTTKKTSKKKV